MEINSKKLTVIIPIYNCEDRLRICLDSICNQTYKNLSIICVNDGSTDNSKKICEEYSLRDKRITVLNYDNHGVSFARNCGIEQADSEYLTFCDADDFLELDSYEKVMNILNKNDIDLLCFGYKRIDNNAITEVKTSFTDNVILNSDFIFNEIITIMLGFKEDFDQSKYSFLPNCWNKIFKKSILSEHNIKFNTKRIISEDSQFCLDYLLEIKTIYFLNETLYNYYRCNSNSLSKQRFIYNIFDMFINSRIKYMNKLPQLPWNSEKEQLKCKHKWLDISNYYYLLDKKNFKSYIQHMFQVYVDLKIYDYASDLKVLYKLDYASKNNDGKSFYKIIKRYLVNRLFRNKFRNLLNKIKHLPNKILKINSH